MHTTISTGGQNSIDCPPIELDLNKRILPPRVEKLLGQLSRDDVKRRQSEHGQHERCGLGDKTKHRDTRQVWQYKGNSNEDQCTHQ